MKFVQSVINHPLAVYLKWGYLAWSVVADLIILSGVIYLVFF